MKVITIVLIAMIVQVCDGRSGKMATSSSEGSVGDARTAQLPPPNFGPPVNWFPQKEVYVTAENDPFLVMVRVTCGVGSPNDVRFELLPPTPSFVALTPLCSAVDSPFAQTLVAIGPHTGDVGKYEVSVAATRCGHPEESVGQPIVKLQLKVKRAR